MAHYAINLTSLEAKDLIRPFGVFVEGLKITFLSAPTDPYPAVTLIGAVAITAKVAIAYFKKESSLKFIDCVVVVASWIGYDCAKNSSTVSIISQANSDLRVQLEKEKKQLDEEKRLMEEQQRELKRLREVNSALEERIPELERAAEKHVSSNRDHSALVEKEKSFLDQEKQELFRIQGLIEAYREELQELESEIEASEKDKQAIKREMAELVEQQKVLNSSLAQKVEELRAIELRMKQRI